MHTTRYPGEIGMRHYATLTGRTKEKALREQGPKQNQHHHSSPTRRRLPAFGKALAEARRKGMRPASNTIVVRLDSWPPDHHIGRDGELIEGPSPSLAWPHIVILPGQAPDGLEFGFLGDLDVLLACWSSRTPPDRVRAMLRELLSVEPRTLGVIDMAKGSPRWWHIKSIAHGVEVAL